jgi:hypothetical protein
MKILIDRVEDLLPIKGVWETAGGADELVTVVFLRGAILSSLGAIETTINEIAIRSSRIEIYHLLSKKVPKTITNRIDYITAISQINGVMSDFAPELLPILSKYREFYEIRNKWAHGHLTVLPGTRGQRLENAWITLANKSPKTSVFEVVNDRWTINEIIQQACETARLANQMTRLAQRITSVLPEM